MRAGGNQRGQPGRTAVAVVVVSARHQVPAAELRLVRERVGAAQVPDIMQQGGADKRGRRRGGRGERRGLQQVLRDGHRLPR